MFPLCRLLRSPVLSWTDEEDSQQSQQTRLVIIIIIIWIVSNDLLIDCRSVILPSCLLLPLPSCISTQTGNQTKVSWNGVMSLWSWNPYFSFLDMTLRGLTGETVQHHFVSPPVSTVRLPVKSKQGWMRNDDFCIMSQYSFMKFYDTIEHNQKPYFYFCKF